MSMNRSSQLTAHRVPSSSLAFEVGATLALAAACLKEALHWDGIGHMDLTAYSFSIAFVIHDFAAKWLILVRGASHKQRRSSVAIAASA